MIPRIIGKETTCVLQLLARLSISTTYNGIGNSNDIRTTRLTCASSWSSGDLTGWARSMSRLWRDTCRSGKVQMHNEEGHREEQAVLVVKKWQQRLAAHSSRQRTTFTRGRQGGRSGQQPCSQVQAKRPKIRRLCCGRTLCGAGAN